jgi:hypothetical protein
VYKWESHEDLPADEEDVDPSTGWTLEGALERDDEELALALLGLPLPAGERLDLEYKLPNGRTLLHYAARLDKPQLTRELLSRGVKYEVFDSHGNTPLDNAASKGFVEVARLLLDKYKAKGELKRALLRPWDAKEAPLFLLTLSTLSTLVEGRQGADRCQRGRPAFHGSDALC